LSPHFSQKIKFQDSTYSWKVVLIVFWDSRGIIHQEYMVTGTKINSELHEDPTEIERTTQSHSSVKES
jgi:hypothetical protein